MIEQGKRYRFTLIDGRTVEGEVRTTQYPQGYGGGNADGLHTIWVTAMFEYWLNPEEIMSVEVID